MVWNIDFSEFQLTSSKSWISLINFIPRLHYLYIPDAILCAYLVRRSLTIRNPLISFVLGLALATFSDNYIALLSSHKLATFESYLLAPIFAAAWIAFNYAPFDIIFKLSRYLSAVFAIIGGFLAGRDLTTGIDLAMNWYPTLSLPVLFTGIGVAAGKYILLYTYSTIYNQRGRNAGPIMCGISLGALGYYYFTDLGHISNTFWFDKEETRLGIIVLMVILALVHYFLNDSFFTRVFTLIGDFAGWFVPYYGSTWTPKSRKNLAPVIEKPVVPRPPEGEKLKME
jgi:hypothetical protein